MIREALPNDFEAILRLYRQPQPKDPILDDGSDRNMFDAILNTPGLTHLVLEVDGPWWPHIPQNHPEHHSRRRPTA